MWWADVISQITSARSKGREASRKRSAFYHERDSTRLQLCFGTTSPWSAAAAQSEAAEAFINRTHKGVAAVEEVTKVWPRNGALDTVDCVRKWNQWLPVRSLG